MDDHQPKAEAIACLTRALELIDGGDFGSIAAPHIDYGLQLLSAEANRMAARQPQSESAL